MGRGDVPRVGQADNAAIIRGKMSEEAAFEGAYQRGLSDGRDEVSETLAEANARIDKLAEERGKYRLRVRELEKALEDIYVLEVTHEQHEFEQSIRVSDGWTCFACDDSVYVPEKKDVKHKPGCILVGTTPSVSDDSAGSSHPPVRSREGDGPVRGGGTTAETAAVIPCPSETGSLVGDYAPSYVQRASEAPTSEEIFRAIAKGVLASGIDPGAIAQLVGCSTTTVKMWATGPACPHPSMRRSAIKAMLSLMPDDEPRPNDAPLGVEALIAESEAAIEEARQQRAMFQEYSSTWHRYDTHVALHTQFVERLKALPAPRTDNPSAVSKQRTAFNHERDLYCWPSGSVWVAAHPWLDVVTQGRTREEAQRAFIEAIALIALHDVDHDGKLSFRLAPPEVVEKWKTLDAESREMNK
jgi:hypothetical protein